MLPQEQIHQIKEQLIQQISSTFPEDKKQSAIRQIEAMDAEQLEQFLIQNNLIKTGQDVAHGTEVSKEQKCIFCSIVSGDIPSYKINENNDAIAILEINPISKGHTIIVPKEHIESKDKLSKETFKLAEKVAKKIKTKLKPKKIITESQNLFGHEIINVLPVYTNETANSEKHKAEEKELLELQNILQTKPKKKTATIKKAKTKTVSSAESKKLWLPRRIP